MRIRTLSEADTEAALDLFCAVVAEGRWLATEAPVDRRETAARWADLVATGEGTILAAEEGGALAGLAALVGRPEPELGMLVAADRRRRGVGAALVEAAAAWARARGARRVVLHVFPHNAAALALYRRHGFVEEALVPGRYARRSGARWDAIRMVRALPPG